jgi:hypothetical protein
MLWFVLALPIFVTFGPQGVYGLVPQTNLNPALDLKFVPFLVMFHIEKYYAYSVDKNNEIQHINSCNGVNGVNGLNGIGGINGADSLDHNGGNGGIGGNGGNGGNGGSGGIDICQLGIGSNGGNGGNGGNDEDANGDVDDDSFEF